MLFGPVSALLYKCLLKNVTLLINDDIWTNELGSHGAQEKVARGEKEKKKKRKKDIRLLCGAVEPVYFIMVRLPVVWMTNLFTGHINNFKQVLEHNEHSLQRKSEIFYLFIFTNSTVQCFRAHKLLALTCQLLSEASCVLARSLWSVANFCSSICSLCKASWRSENDTITALQLISCTNYLASF